MKKYGGILRLGLLLIAAPLLVWRLAVGDTVENWQKCKRETRELATMEVSAGKPDTNISKTEVPSEELIQSGLLLEHLIPMLAEYGATIERYSPFVTSDQNGARIHTAEITIRGGFHPSVRAIDFIESGLQGCILRSVNFRSSLKQGKDTGLRVNIIVEQLIISGI